ncbi:hypothetical protein ROHU_020769 [Labeo rohita]|uniref:Uncharacterized protein n=1 Tax=Labeo rohita TaxID=84645 RepID=A0A498MZN3_LABRO|nr:hypothetical protein ROHU_020769 [Labeo rohita]
MQPTIFPERSCLIYGCAQGTKGTEKAIKSAICNQKATYRVTTTYTKNPRLFNVIYVKIDYRKAFQGPFIFFSHFEDYK